MAQIDPMHGSVNDPYTLMAASRGFEDGAATLFDKLQVATDTLHKDPSSPAALADYQAALSSYSLLRNAQSNTIKAIKDIAAAIIANFR